MEIYQVRKARTTEKKLDKSCFQVCRVADTLEESQKQLQTILEHELEYYFNDLKDNEIICYKIVKLYGPIDNVIMHDLERYKFDKDSIGSWLDPHYGY